MATLSNEEQRVAIVNQAVDMLGEHFDNVQIFCNTVEDGETYRVKNGRGNTYARLAQAQEWLERVKAQDAKEAVDEMEDD
jgi:hypothetical protein